MVEGNDCDDDGDDDERQRQPKTITINFNPSDTRLLSRDCTPLSLARLRATEMLRSSVLDLCSCSGQSLSHCAIVFVTTAVHFI